MISPNLQLFTVKEFADRVRVSLASAYLIVNRGDIPFVRVGPKRGAIRIHATDLENYLLSQTATIDQTKRPTSQKRAASPVLRHIRLK